VLPAQTVRDRPRLRCPPHTIRGMTTDPSAGADATMLLQAAAHGDRDAADRLLPLVYDQLRQAAQRELMSERAGHTLSATALVHEAYLKLVGPREVPWAGRGHFYVAAAEAMRRILLDHAKARGREKRGGQGGVPRRRVEFASIAELVASADSEEIVSFDEAVRRLENESAEAARVVQLRFFAGLSVEQTAQVLGVSDRTVNRLWTFARAWLHRAMSDAGPGS
jgi:RNA polymerase sigma factor (TIGR02999 family)